MILCASFVRNPRSGLAWLKPFVRVLPVASAPLAVLSYFLLGTHGSSAMRSALTQALALLPISTLRARLQAVLEIDVSGKLAALTVPILYLRATHDRVVPRTAAQLIAQLNPRARIVPIEAPHFLLQAAPADASRAVADFARALHGEGD